MKVIVTGCQGQVGRCLVAQLSQRNEIELIALDKQALDITNLEQVNSMLDSIAADVIINAAAYTAVDDAEIDNALAFAINRDGPGNLARAAKRHDALLLHISTDYVFDGNKAGPYKESDQANPQTVYGQSKLAGELKIQSSGCRYGILRTAWVFELQGHNFVNTMLRLAETRDELGIVTDQLGGPTWARDISDALIKMMEKMKSDRSVQSGLYHFAGYPHCSWYEFAKEIFTLAVKTGRLDKTPVLSGIATSDYPMLATRPANSRLDCSKIQREFGINPSNWHAALESLFSSQPKENCA